MNMNAYLTGMLRPGFPKLNLASTSRMSSSENLIVHFGIVISSKSAASVIGAV